MSRLKAIILTLFILALICALVWMSGITRLSIWTNSSDMRFEPDSSFKGRIVVTLVERKTGPEQKLEFMIDLDRGQISTSPSSQFIGPLSPGGRIDDCQHAGPVEVPAPSSQLFANCLLEGVNRSYVSTVVNIMRRNSNVQVRQWAAPEGWDICGLTWSGDSGSVAVLLEKERMDLGPVGLLSAASGHPIPLETFEVTVLSVQPGRELKLPIIRKDSPSGWARIDWIQ